MSAHLISAIKWNCNKTPGLDPIQAAPNGAAPGRAHPYLEQRLQTAFENLAFADCNSGATPTFDVVCNKARAVLNYSYLTSFSFSFFWGVYFRPRSEQTFLGIAGLQLCPAPLFCAARTTSHPWFCSHGLQYPMETWYIIIHTSLDQKLSKGLCNFSEGLF